MTTLCKSRRSASLGFVGASVPTGPFVLCWAPPKNKKKPKNLNFEGLVKERQLSNLLCALNSYCNG